MRLTWWCWCVCGFVSIARVLCRRQVVCLLRMIVLKIWDKIVLTVVLRVALFLLRVYFAGGKSCCACKWFRWSFEIRMSWRLCCVWLSFFFYVCTLQAVGRVAHVNDFVEDLREDWPDGVVGGFGSIACVFCRMLVMWCMWMNALNIWEKRRLTWRWCVCGIVVVPL